MRYKALVVDDEPMIRYGLCSCVNWEAEGITLVGEAANGEAALKRMKDERIDILVTDIKMPLMDGLELIRHASVLQPDMKVVLVSSYSDFQYAVEAVKTGVVIDYLLKPTMEPEDLVKVLRTCREQLDRDRLHEEQAQQARLAERSSRLIVFQETLRDSLNGVETPLAWRPDWATGSVMIAIWQEDAAIVQAEYDERLQRRQLESAKAMLNEKWDDCGITFMGVADELITLIGNEQEAGATRLFACHKELCAQLQLSLTAGISRPFHLLAAESLRRAYSEAEYGLDMAFFQGRGQCYLMPVSASASRGGTGDCDGLATAGDGLGGLHEQFSRAYALADREGCLELLAQYERQWKSGRFTRHMIVGHARSLLIMMCARDLQWDRVERLQRTTAQLTYMKRLPTLAALITYIREALDRHWVPEHQRMDMDAGGAHVIQLALSYIQDNYRRDISLQQVADYVHMSKNYFSEQFKQKTGMNFIDFVISLRIQHAKHLLEHTVLKVLEVGEESGFNSPKHFLKLFKRQAGCTPAEYREKRQSREGHDDAPGEK